MNAADPDNALSLRRLKRLKEDLDRLAFDFQQAGMWDEVKGAFEDLDEAIAEKWSEGQ